MMVQFFESKDLYLRGFTGHELTGNCIYAFHYPGLGMHTAAQSARQWRMHADHLAPQQERLARLEGYLSQLEPTMERVRVELEKAEKMVRSRTPLGPEAERALGGFVSVALVMLIVIVKIFIYLPFVSMLNGIEFV